MEFATLNEYTFERRGLEVVSTTENIRWLSTKQTGNEWCHCAQSPCENKSTVFLLAECQWTWLTDHKETLLSALPPMKNVPSSDNSIANFP